MSLIGITFLLLSEAYVVKTSITHNKYLTPQFLEDNDPFSTKSAANFYIQILHSLSFF